MRSLLLSLLLAAPASAQIRAVEPVVSLAPAPSAVALFPTALTPTLSLPLAASKADLTPSVVPSPLLPARTAVVLRDDADRLYVSLADIHSRAKNGESEKSLEDLKRRFLADFDGALKGLDVAVVGDALNGKVKELRAARAKAEKSLLKAAPEDRAAASKAYSDVSGALAAHQLMLARGLLTTKTKLGPKAVKRNAALWALVGAHNSAAAAAAEAAYVEALARGEDAYGDGSPYLYWSRWRNVRTELEQAARDARNGREAKASKTLEELSAVLKGTGDASDAEAAAALEALVGSPNSEGILAAVALVKHPSLKTRGPVSYSDMSATVRAQVHALESGRADYLETAANEAALRRAAALLSSPRPSGADTLLASKLAASAHEWAARGRVEQKKIAARNLDAASLALARGDLTLAAKHLEFAADALSERREELLRIAASVRRRLLKRTTGV